MVNINDALKAIGYALLVLFFLMGIMRQFNSFSELKRPEQALKLFLRFVLAKAAVTWGLDLMMAMFTIAQGIVAKIMETSGVAGQGGMSLPQSMIDTIEACGFWESVPLWAVTLIGSLIVTILSFIMIMTVYGRFFKIYIYAAIAPIPLSSFAGRRPATLESRLSSPMRRSAWRARSLCLPASSIRSLPRHRLLLIHLQRQ